MPRYGYRELVRLDAVGNLLAAAALARLAERMLGLVLVLYALEQFQSPQLAGWVAFAAMAPGLLASPLAGAVLDRTGAAWGIAADMACSAVCVLGIALICLVHADSPASVLSLTALCAVTNPLSAAGVRTLLPSLVPPAALGRANALDTSIYAAVEVGGPALAGALFGCTGTVATLLVIAVCYAAAGVALLPAMRDQRRAPLARQGGMLADAMAGLVHVLRHRSLRVLALSYALYQVAWGILLVAVPVFVTGLAGAGARADLLVGMFWAGCGIAGGLGALLAGRHAAPGQERAMLALGMLLTPLALYPLCVSFGLPGVCLGLALAGMLAGPVDVGLLTLRQRRTEPGWLGRVMAVSIGLNLSGAPIGSALGGALLGWSVPGAFAAAALACLAGAGVTRWLPKD